MVIKVFRVNKRQLYIINYFNITIITVCNHLMNKYFCIHFVINILESSLKSLYTKNDSERRQFVNLGYFILYYLYCHDF